MRKKITLMVITLAIVVPIISAITFPVVTQWWDAPPDLPREPDEVILFSVQFDESGEGPKAGDNREQLYKYSVLGRVAITDPERRREIVSAVQRDIRAGAPAQARCFYPRHIVRVVKDGTTIDTVICYECHNFKVHVNGGFHRGLTRAIGSESRPLLNQILADAGVPLAP
ncbi:Uncharacterized protein OS=Pirellula staleyi (strain ATCC 27377 / DSM 6068 / ICPB 4128) GN=Psta_0497 PE=4 SV=1 [Gemmata massiliana]|uniref:Uncharacterized protein n=1 Tax=Gemmata massiliana TaxID=1210884 RepID=A0A6P2CXD3_9BACT|nr:hypothetical protein [Gemmata massiliana]VTR93247.1 Uncharacterized protein OS=Pirellula staleyi (strain ATCC 27377 / DSM 6068 / ICPB 4128) GN=Psta_0497 PE=4 SV=1 [Gemmata massiliana]